MCNHDCNCCGGGCIDFFTALCEIVYEFVGCFFLLIFIFLKAIVVFAPERSNIGEPIGIRLINAYKARKNRPTSGDRS